MRQVQVEVVQGDRRSIDRRAQPPEGVDAVYLDAFVARHREHLLAIVRRSLDRRAGAPR